MCPVQSDISFGTPCSIILAVYGYPLTCYAWVWLHLPLPASKPNNLNPPNVITAASLLFQSGFLMFSLMKDKTWGTMWCSVHWASSIRQTPPALQGFQSSSSSNSSCKWWVKTIHLNPLSPNIHIQILQTDLQTSPLRISWENLIKDHGIFSMVIILLILLTLSLDSVWILLGEKWCWSLLGLKGLSNDLVNFNQSTNQSFSLTCYVEELKNSFKIRTCI